MASPGRNWHVGASLLWSPHTSWHHREREEAGVEGQGTWVSTPTCPQSRHPHGKNAHRGLSVSYCSCTQDDSNSSVILQRKVTATARCLSHVPEITAAMGAVQARKAETATSSLLVLSTNDMPAMAQRPGQALAQQTSPDGCRISSDPDVEPIPLLYCPPPRPLTRSRTPGLPAEGLVCEQ